VEAEARLVAPGLKFGAGPHELGDYYVALGELCATGNAQVQPFGTDYDSAQLAYAEAEQANGVEAKLDIVLLSADSLETIKQTHSSYFSGEVNRLEELLPS
jgi:hypothetical protein